MVHKYFSRAARRRVSNSVLESAGPAAAGAREAGIPGMRRGSGSVPAHAPGTP